ncbi:exopolysaccharide biosynthesis protein [Nostoc sp.]
MKPGIPWLKRIEAIARSRLSYMCTTLPSRVTIGIAIACIKLNNCTPCSLALVWIF